MERQFMNMSYKSCKHINIQCNLTELSHDDSGQFDKVPTDYTTTTTQKNYGGDYNAAQLERSRFILLQAREYGCLKWFNKRYPMERNNRNLAPNLWEGQIETTDNALQAFPMPPKGCFKPELVYESSMPSSQPEVVESSSSSDSSTSDAESTDCEIIEEKSNRLQHDHQTKTSEEEEFWANVTQLFHQLHSISRSLTKTDKKLSSGSNKERKMACNHLADLYTELGELRTSVQKAEKDYKKKSYREILNVLPTSAVQDFKQRFGFKRCLPTSLGEVLGKCENLFASFRQLLKSRASLIEPHKAVLSIAYKDM